MCNNKLWESHRIILPEIRERALKRCKDCRFFVRIRGKEEERWGCVAGVPGYGTLQVRVPEAIHVVDILRKVGKAGLGEILACGNPDAQACGLYRAKINFSWKRRSAKIN